jgi:hypothetical protein
MALCPECGAPVPDESAACPRCGHPLAVPPLKSESSSSKPFPDDPLDQTVLPPMKPGAVTGLGLLQIAGGITIVILGLIFSSVDPVVGAPFYLLGILVAVIGKALLDGRPWAWTFDTVLNFLGVPLGITLLALGNLLAVVTIVGNLLILYFLVKPETRQFFGKSFKSLRTKS